MEDFKLRSFLNLSNKDRYLRNALNKATKNLENVNYLRLIITKEIIPIARKKGFNFTKDDLINYFKSNISKLKKIDLKAVSGGVSAGKLTFGIANGIIGLTSIINYKVMCNNGNESLNSKEESSNSYSKKHNKEDNDLTGPNLNNLLSEGNKTSVNNVNWGSQNNNPLGGRKKIGANEKSLNEIMDIIESSEYKITKMKKLGDKIDKPS